MKAIRRTAAVAGSGLLVLAIWSCGAEPEGWTPILEETSTTFLRSEIDALAARVGAARSGLASDPEAAVAELDAAQRSLVHLQDYYLPLLEARQLAYNAYSHHSLGQIAQAARALDRIEALLLGVAKTGHGELLVREMEEPLGRIEDARAALEAGTGNAAEDLEALAARLNFLLVKGELVLNE